MRDRITVNCPACDEELGEVIFDDRMRVELSSECPECGRWMRLFVNRDKVYRKQYPHDAEGLKHLPPYP